MMYEKYKVLYELKELLEQTFEDKNCNNKELAIISDWFDENFSLLSQYGYTELRNAINRIIEDGVFTLKERNTLIQILQKYL